MAKSFKLNNLWNVNSLKINSTVEAKGILDSLANVTDATSSYLVTAGAIKAELSTLDSQNLSYVYCSDGKLPAALTENTIYIVKGDGTTGENLCTEYICYKVGDQLLTDKIGEVGFDYSAYTTEIKKLEDADKKFDDILTGFGGTDQPATVAGAIDTLKTTGVTSTSTATDGHVTVTLGGTVGTPTVSVTTSDIAAASIIGDGFSASNTVAGQLADVKDTADSAIQGVGTVTSDATHGVAITLAEDEDDETLLTASVAVTPAAFTEMGMTWNDTENSKLTTAGNVKSAIAQAISDEDDVVDAKSVAMTSMEGAVTADAKVKVAITGTIGTHSIAVTTNDIASASDLSALDTYVKGEKVTGEGGAISGGIEKRLAAVEDSIGEGTEGIGARVSDLETSVGTASDAADAEGSVYARIAATKAVADDALQGVNEVTDKGSHGLTLSASEDDSHNLTVGLAVVAATQNSDTKVLSTDNFATGAQVENRVTTAVGTVQGVQMPGEKYDTDKFVTVTLGGTIGAPTLAVATNNIAKASELTQEIADRKSGDAALVASVTGDLTTGTASEIVKVIASTAAGDATAGTGKAVTLHTQVTTASTTTTDGKIVINTSTEGALVTAKAAQDAIDAAETRAKSAQTYVGDSTTVAVAESTNTISAITAAVAENGAALTTGGQVHTAIEAAKTTLVGTTDCTTETKTITSALSVAEAAKTAAETAQTTANGKVSVVAVGDTRNFSSTASGSNDTKTYTISVVTDSPLDVLIKAFTAAKTAVPADATNTFAARLTKLFQLADNLDVEPDGN